jgi:hypothetical protein
MKKCPFCQEEIQDTAIKCRYCGEWLDKKEEPALNKNVFNGKVSTPPASSPQQSTITTPPIEKKKKNPYKSFSWKYLIIAFFIAFFLNIFAAAVAGTEPRKNIIWTVFWIYLTIEAWKYWKWKALLPYPIYILTVMITAMIMKSIGVVYTAWTNLIVMITLNIGGLIIFYTLFLRSQTEASEDATIEKMLNNADAWPVEEAERIAPHNIDNGEFTPVLSDADFEGRAARIKEIADKYR